MRFSLAVMGHEDRAEYFPYLKEKLGDVPFLVDKGRPGDPENLGLWNNCKRAWLAYDREAEWHVVLQEDSIICKDFHKKLEDVLTQIGKLDVVLSLYAGSRLSTQIERAMRARRNRVLSGMILNENALCMRVKHIEPMVQYCDMRGAITDKYIQTFARRKGLVIYYPIPSLVDHRSDESIYRKLYAKPFADSERHAVWFADNKYGEEIDYDY
jgi:hypothetical protein